MIMYKYQNVSDEHQVISGIGEVAPGDTIETEVEFFNPNFKLLGQDQNESNGVVGVVMQQENMVTDIEPINNVNEEIQ